jgi:competence protein ComEA
VDLNRASAAELATLPRIGPALAARIVADRARRGPFAAAEDLDRVRGVGPGILAAIRDEITVGPAAGDTLRAD